MDLTKQLQEYQHELNVENQKGALRNGDVIATLETDIAELTAQIEAQEQEKEAEVVNQQVAKFMDSLDFEGAEPKELFLNYSAEGAETSYNYVNAVIQNAVARLKKADLQRIKELETANANLTDKVTLLSDDNERMSLELYTKRMEIAELDNRLSNAAAQLDEEREEVARLNSQVDDLRKEIAIGAVAATQVVEIDTRSAREKWLEEKQKEEDAKPIIYNIRWEDDFKKTVYLAELAETDETIKFSHLSMSGDITNPTAMKGKYRVVTEADATTFRNAYLAAQEPVEASSGGTVAVEEQPVEVAPFQEETPSAGLELVTETSTVVGQVSTEDFQALKAEVAAINAYLGRY